MRIDFDGYLTNVVIALMVENLKRAGKIPQRASDQEAFDQLAGLSVGDFNLEQTKLTDGIGILWTLRSPWDGAHMSGNVTFTTSAVAELRNLHRKLLSSAAPRHIEFPAGTTFLIHSA